MQAASRHGLGTMAGRLWPGHLTDGIRPDGSIILAVRDCQRRPMRKDETVIGCWMGEKRINLTVVGVLEFVLRRIYL